MIRLMPECAEPTLLAQKECEITIHGKKIEYTATVEETFYADDAGEKAASVGSFSYIAKNMGPNRPIIFVYNGGPGASSVWMHMGLFGPRRIHIDDPVDPSPVPPYYLEDNPHCLLDICDLVMIDPPHTGFARLYKPEDYSLVYGADQDAFLLSLFIEHWLTVNHRMNSPRFLAGESYGSLRNCQLMRQLMGGCMPQDHRVTAIPVNGLMFFGTCIELGQEKGIPYSEMVTMFDTYAATCWYFRKDRQKQSVWEYIEEAEDFLAKEFLPCDFLGEKCPPEVREEVMKKVMYYTGVSEYYLRNHNMQINNEDFMEEAIRDMGLDVGLYDSRYTMPHSTCKAFHDVISDDPAMGKYTPSFIAAMALLRDELGIETDREYRAIDVGKAFPITGEVSNTESLVDGMRRNRKMQLFFATGIYDLCTPMGKTRYNLHHLGLDSSRVMEKEYESGHMPYLGEDSCIALEKDMREYLAKALA